jgi:tRNA threonylcarbamoyladenosine biosynthesis protein TsaB
MLVLALDTTTRAGSAALRRDGDLLEVHQGDPARTHAARLPADLVDLLGRQHLTLADVDLFAVAAGPGSFTGLRIGIATIQGLAFAHDKPVVAVSALDALAYTAFGLREAWPDDALIAAWMDAQRQEVFTSLYRPISGAGEAESVIGLRELELVEGAAVDEPRLTVNRWSPLVSRRTLLAIGDGALTFESVLSGLPAAALEVVRRVPPLAPAIAAIALRRGLAGQGTAPHAIKPVYVRRPDAELARDRRLRAAASQTNAKGSE